MNVLFNNAGILRMGTNETITLDEQHMTIDINIKGILNMIFSENFIEIDDVLKQVTTIN